MTVSVSLEGHEALNSSIEATLGDWDVVGYGRRLWERDGTLWGPVGTPELDDRLGWLDAPGHPVAVDLAGDFRDIVLIGMGGSSLAPEMFMAMFGSDGPELHVLDSTHPAAVQAMVDRIDVSNSLFVVSSKSGGTLETLSLFRFFWALVSANRTDPGVQFVAITDPASGLEALATERQFRAIYRADPTVGGRYSALTAFGQVPARLIGADVDGMLSRARAMATLTGPDVRPSENPALQFGAFMGAGSVLGRDKLTILCTESLRAFPSWLEQLVAESTGKNGVGILPVAGEPLGSPDRYGSDRLFVRYGLASDPDLETLDQRLAAIGAPVMRFTLADKVDVGGEILRAEIATAAAGSVLNIHPFNQPDVQSAKVAAQRAMAGESAGTVMAEPLAGEAGRRAVGELLSRSEPPDYVALMAYVPQNPTAQADLIWAQETIRDARRTATTAGFGPRFLHSTGQYHKGGPDTAVCIQILDQASVGNQADRLAVPETDFTFGKLIAAQAAGDAQALLSQNRRLLRVVVDDVSEFRSWLDA